MKNFNENIDTSRAIRLIKNIMTNLAHVQNSDSIIHSFISNIEFEQSRNSTRLAFSSIYGQVEAFILLEDFKLTINRSKKLPSVYDSMIPAKSQWTQYTMTGDKDLDKTNVIDLLSALGRHKPLKHDLYYTEEDRETKIMSFSHDGPWCGDDSFAYTFIKQLGFDLSSITSDDCNFLMNAFGIGQDYIEKPEIGLYIKVAFQQVFETLKEFGHTKDIQFTFDDDDYKLHYLEYNQFQGVVLESRNGLFLIASDYMSEKLKVWQCINLVPECLFDIDLSKGEIFKGEEFLKSCHWNSEFPFEMSHYACPKSAETLIKDFYSNKAEFVYSSDVGFNQKYSHKFNSLLNNLDYAQEVLLDYYHINIETCIQNDVDYRKPEYYIRKALHQNMGVDRATVLFKLFSTINNNYMWDGKGFISDNQYVFDYPPHPNEQVRGAIVDNPFMYLNMTRIFSLPTNITKEWYLVAKEYIGYINEWMENHNNKESDEYQHALSYLDELNQI